MIRAPAALASRGAATGTEDGAGPVDTFEPAADGADALDMAGVTPEVGASFGCAQARGARIRATMRWTRPRMMDVEVTRTLSGEHDLSLESPHGLGMQSPEALGNPLRVPCLFMVDVSRPTREPVDALEGAAPFADLDAALGGGRG